jgi:hypothetical protein
MRGRRLRRQLWLLRAGIDLQRHWDLRIALGPVRVERRVRRVLDERWLRILSKLGTLRSRQPDGADGGDVRHVGRERVGLLDGVCSELRRAHVWERWLWRDVRRVRRRTELWRERIVRRADDRSVCKFANM